MLSAAKATPEYGEKQEQVLLAKKQLRTCSTLFLYISLPLFLHDCNVKLPETS